MLQDALLVFAFQNNLNQVVKCLALKNTVKSSPVASNSVILSLATHLTFHYPYLDLTHNPIMTPKIHPEKQEMNSYLSTHPLQQFWCDKFVESIIKNHAIRKQNTLFILIELNGTQFDNVSNYQEKLKKFEIIQSLNWQDEVLKKVSGYQQLPRKNTNIGYLNVSGSQLRTDMFKPILNVKATILGQLFNNQKWLSFDVLKGQIPTVQQFSHFDSVIIPGSTNSVLQNIPEIQKMKQNLFKAFKISNKLKIFGICYGHQLIAQQFQANVCKKIRTDKIQNYQLEQNKIIQLKKNLKYLENFPTSNSQPLLLLEHHEDYVQTIPEDFHLLATSSTSKVEVLLHKSGRILSFQSHPEYYYEFTQGYLQRLSRYDAKIQSSQYKCRKGDDNFINNHHQSADKMRKMMSEFLNWNE